jgi:hypothetical protein
MYVVSLGGLGGKAVRLPSRFRVLAVKMLPVGVRCAFTVTVQWPHHGEARSLRAMFITIGLLIIFNLALHLLKWPVSELE